MDFIRNFLRVFLIFAGIGVFLGIALGVIFLLDLGAATIGVIPTLAVYIFLACCLVGGLLTWDDHRS